MRFEVPQFVDIEDKIFGPLTFRQFVYLAGGAGVSVVLWVFLPTLIALPLVAVAVGLALALAFYKFNGKPFVFVIEAALRYATGGKLYIWKKEVKPVTRQEQTSASASELSVPRLSDSKLRDLAWSLDVHDSLYSDTKEQ
ncbi:MAG: PrgI family protein [Candidatus Pacebacteria bacterium]|nr:PrgI family protein [Candidatus Paceibacterota bacterium]